MSDDTQAQPQLPQPLKTARSPDYEVVFANHIRLRVGPGEFGVVFGFVEDVEAGPLAEEKVHIAFSPQTAKLLCVALQAALTSYEEEYGSIGQLRIKPVDAQNVYRAIAEAIGPLVQ